MRRRFNKFKPVPASLSKTTKQEGSAEPLPMKAAVQALLELKSAPSHLTIRLRGENCAILDWCVLTRTAGEKIHLHVDARCDVRLLAEAGALLKGYPEIELLQRRVWIEGDDYKTGKAAVTKYCEHLANSVKLHDEPAKPNTPEAS